jgi:hypothetical protein
MKFEQKFEEKFEEKFEDKFDDTDGDEDDDDYDDEDTKDRYEEVAGQHPLRSPRFTRQARETLVMCIVAGLIAALLWGVYKWTNASRFTPPLYTGGTHLDD